MIPLSYDQIRILLANGTGLTVDAKKYSADQLSVLAANAASGGAQLTIQGTGILSVDNLRVIGANGKGRVVFSGVIF
jgi:hypothetical protein